MFRYRFSNKQLKVNWLRRSIRIYCLRYTQRQHSQRSLDESYGSIESIVIAQRRSYTIHNIKHTRAHAVSHTLTCRAHEGWVDQVAICLCFYQRTNEDTKKNRRKLMSRRYGIDNWVGWVGWVALFQLVDFVLKRFRVTLREMMVFYISIHIWMSVFSFESFSFLLTYVSNFN